MRVGQRVVLDSQPGTIVQVTVDKERYVYTIKPDISPRHRWIVGGEQLKTGRLKVIIEEAAE